MKTTYILFEKGRVPIVLEGMTLKIFGGKLPDALFPHSSSHVLHHMVGACIHGGEFPGLASFKACIGIVQFYTSPFTWTAGKLA